MTAARRILAHLWRRIHDHQCTCGEWVLLKEMDTHRQIEHAGDELI